MSTCSYLKYKSDDYDNRNNYFKNKVYQKRCQSGGPAMVSVKYERNLFCNSMDIK